MRRIKPPPNDLESERRDLQVESNKDLVDCRKQRSCDLNDNVRQIRRPARAINSAVGGVGMTSSKSEESAVTSVRKSNTTSGTSSLIPNYSTRVRATDNIGGEVSEKKLRCRRSLLEDPRFVALMSSLIDHVHPTCDLVELRPTINATRGTTRLHVGYTGAAPGQLSSFRR